MLFLKGDGLFLQWGGAVSSSSHDVLSLKSASPFMNPIHVCSLHNECVGVTAYRFVLQN